MNASPEFTGEAFASLTLFIKTEYDTGNKEMKQETQRVEEKLVIPQKKLNQILDYDWEGVEASVTASVSTKVSDSVYWGDGTWDRIPYSIEIFSSITLKCDQNRESIRLAHNLAYDMAWDASREHIVKARNGHVMDIKDRLFPELFSND